MPPIRLTAGSASFGIDPELGGRLTSLVVDGLELFVTESAAPSHWGCFPMAPWAGRLRGGRFTHGGVEHQLPTNDGPNAIHGTVRKAPWGMDEASTTTATLSCPLGVDWPFPGRAVQVVELSSDAVTLQMEVHSDGASFPAALGWHPWWRRSLDRGEPVEVDLDAGAMWARGDDGLPTGELVAPPQDGPFDDCFTELRRPPVLRWPGALALTMRTDCQHVVLFDEPPDAVCLEPQTGPPDALHLAPVLVAPGAPLTARTVLTWGAG